MEKLTICRVCLSPNGQHVVKNEQLQDVYEKLTAIPMAQRPLVLCYICFAQLKASYRFKLKCLKAVEILRQMLAVGDQVLDPTQIDRSGVNQLTISSVEGVMISGSNGETTAKGIASMIVYEEDIKTEEQVIEDATTTQGFGKTSPNISITNSIESQKVDSDQDFSKCQQIMILERYLPPRSSNLDVNETQLMCGNIFVCNTCNKSFIEKSELIAHECMSAVMRPHVCHECDKGFTTRRHLKTHALTHTAIPIAKEIKVEHEVDKTIHVKHANTRTDMYPAKESSNNELTNLAPIDSSDIGTPLLFMSQVNIKTTNDGFVEVSNLKLSDTGAGPHVCNVCDKCFPYKSHLYNHLIMHTGGRPHVCTVCEKSFAHRSHLVKHARSHNVCGVCNKKYASNYSLNVHMRTHAGMKPYECNICNKKFTVKSSLKNHMRIHTRKMFVCYICNQKFIGKDSLLKHIVAGKHKRRTVRSK